MGSGSRVSQPPRFASAFIRLAYSALVIRILAVRLLIAAGSESVVPGRRGTRARSRQPSRTSRARPGRLIVTSVVPRVASVPSSIPFAAGQTKVSVSVTALTAGRSAVTVSVDCRRDGRDGDDHDPVTASAIVIVTNPGPSPNRPPAASAGGPYAGTVGQAVTFAGSASDPDGDPLAVTWDFGDGSIGNGLAPTHTYASSGTFTATIAADDGRGGRATASASVTVVEPPPPPNHPPTVSAGGPYAGTVGQAVTFAGTASDPDGDPVAVTWHFGDGSIGNGLAPTHTYASSGTFTATIAADDGRGGHATASARSPWWSHRHRRIIRPR